MDSPHFSLAAALAAPLTPPQWVSNDCWGSLVLQIGPKDKISNNGEGQGVGETALSGAGAELSYKRFSVKEATRPRRPRQGRTKGETAEVFHVFCSWISRNPASYFDSTAAHPQFCTFTRRFERETNDGAAASKGIMMKTSFLNLKFCFIILPSSRFENQHWLHLCHH